MNPVCFICSHDAEQGGIYCFRVHSDGHMEQLSYYPLDRPGYLAWEGDTLYAVQREALPSQSGVVRFHVNGDYTLTPFGDTLMTHGVVAAHVCVFNGQIYCPNYLSGTTICLPDRMMVHLGKGVDPDRQECSHPHQVLPTPDGKYILVNDLGTDEIRMFDTAFTHEIATAKTPAGSGARHGIFSPDGAYYYCVGEMGGNVSVYAYTNQRLTYLDTVSVLPETYHGYNKSSAIRIYNGRLYVSNRGHDSVCVLDMEGAKLTVKGFIPVLGESPREFNFVGDFLISGNEDTDDVTVFKMRPDGFGDDCGVRLPIKKPWGILPYPG